MFWRAGCSLLRAGCLGISKLHFLIKKKKDEKIFSCIFFLQFAHQNPGSDRIRIHFKCWIWIRIHWTQHCLAIFEGLLSTVVSLKLSRENIQLFKTWNFGIFISWWACLAFQYPKNWVSIELALNGGGWPQEKIQVVSSGLSHSCSVPMKIRVSDPYPDPHGSALIWVAGSGSAFKLRIRIQEGKNDPQK